MGIFSGRHFPVTSFCEQCAGNYPLRGELTGAVAKLGGEQRRLSFSVPDGRCVWAFSGRLEDPVDDHRVRVRLPVGKHRALPFPQ